MAALLPGVSIESFHLGADPVAWPAQVGVEQRPIHC